MLSLFSAFIVACGTTHLLEIWTLWYPTNWLSEGMKPITAVVSLTTAIVLVLIVPQMLALFRPAQLKLANAALQKEIADRKRIEDEREQAELAVSRLAAIVESSGDAIVGKSLDGTITSWNAGAERLFGYTAAEVIDRSISILIPPGRVDELSYVLERIKDGEIIESYETVRVRKDGQRINIAATISPIKDAAGQVIGAAKIARNITARKQAEESLRRYERIVSATTDAIMLLDLNYAYQSVNQAYLNWYDKQQDDVLGHSVSDFLPLDLYETTVKPRLDQCLAGQVVQYEMWNDYPTLRAQFLSVTYVPYFDVNQTIAGVVVSLRDITRLKQAEIELELQSTIVRNMAEGVSMVKVSDGHFVYANPKFERMFGYDADELIGQHVAIINYENKNTNTTALYKKLARTILEWGEASYEIHSVKKDGTPLWCQATTSVFNHPTYGTVFVVVQQNITERKQAEKRLQASLKEKDVLLKEIHHRVKNNLGVVDGLLQMQSRRSQSVEVREILKESHNRIASIALVHEKLYSSHDLAMIDFTHYIADLTAHLFDSYNIHTNQIKLTTQIDNVLLDIDTAIPCGLIINELISNALKYAFLNRSNGAIQVTLHQRQDQRLLLTVQDNGVGLPQDFDLKGTKTLGLNLVKGLVKQLQGTLEINSEPGDTAITISMEK